MEQENEKNKQEIDLGFTFVTTLITTIITVICEKILGFFNVWWFLGLLIWLIIGGLILFLIKQGLTSTNPKQFMTIIVIFIVVSILVFFFAGFVESTKEKGPSLDVDNNQIITGTPTSTESQEPTMPLTPTVADTPTPVPTNTPTPTPTNTPTPVPTNTPTSTPTNTPIPVPTNTPTPTPTNTPTSVPTNTPIPTPTNTPTPTATSTPTPIPQYKVTFDSNGGSIVANQTVTYGGILSEFPEPTRDYYRFLGWTYNGQKVTSINVEHDMVLEAKWEEKEASDWVLASYVPSGTWIVDEKWTYIKTETTESTSSFLDGWISNGYRVETVAEGTFEYADFPTGFDTSSSIYKEMYQGDLRPAVADGATREILSDNRKGYVYWHYAFPLAEPCDAGNRTVGPAYNTKFTAGYTTIFNAFKSSKDYTTKTNNSGGGGMVYKITDTHTSYEESGGSYWWFRFEYYTCTYKDTINIYKHYKTIQMESETEIIPNDVVSNVTKWVKYIER